MRHSLNGVSINWREEGTGDPVVFVHGFPFDSRMWQPQLSDVPAGWRFIAPDLRGFGASEAGTRPFTMDLFADDLIALLDHLELEQAVFCALSMGGYIALSLYDRYPGRVRALVLAATRAGADDAEAARKRHELAARARKEGTQAVVDAMLPKLVAGVTNIQKPEVPELLREMMEATAPESMARALEAMAARRDYSDKLDQINVSTMVVRGDQDEIIARGDGEQLARTIRGSRHETIQNVGHLPNLEAPDVFNTALHHFLGLLPPPFKLGDLSLNF